MESGNDIAGLIEINNLLHNYISLAIDEKEVFTNDPFIRMLSIRAIVIENNKNELTGLVGGYEGTGQSAGKVFLDEWKKNVLFQCSTENAPNTPGLEFCIVAVLEAYNTVLNTKSLTSCTNKSVLMDQKYFLQKFLIDMIKCREFNIEAVDSVLTV